MARPPREDWVPVMLAAAAERLRAGEDVKVVELAKELDASPALVHFYFGDRQHLVDEAWREVLTAFVDPDRERVEDAGSRRDWDAMRRLIGEILSPEREATRAAHLRAVAEAKRSPDLAGTIAEVHEETVRAWADLLRLTIERGGAETPFSHEAIALLVVAVPLGLSAVAPDLDDERRAEVADAYTAMLRAVMDAGYSPHA